MLCTDVRSFQEQFRFFTMEDVRSGEETKRREVLELFVTKTKILALIGTCSLFLKNIFPSLGSRPFHDSHIYDLNKNNK